MSPKYQDIRFRLMKGKYRSLLMPTTFGHWHVNEYAGKKWKTIKEPCEDCKEQGCLWCFGSGYVYGTIVRDL